MPTSPARPSTRAPLSVARARACRAGSAVGSAPAPWPAWRRCPFPSTCRGCYWRRSRRSQAHGHSPGQKIRHRGHAAGQLHVGSGRAPARYPTRQEIHVPVGRATACRPRCWPWAAPGGAGAPLEVAVVLQAVGHSRAVSDRWMIQRVLCLSARALLFRAGPASRCRPHGAPPPPAPGDGLHRCGGAPRWNRGPCRGGRNRGKGIVEHLPTTARMPVSSTARATASVNRYMSQKVVVPERSISATASFVPQYTKS